jgi:hypothetical protein
MRDLALTWRQQLPFILRLLKRRDRMMTGFDLLVEMADAADRHEANVREAQAAAEANEVVLSAAMEVSQS